MSKPERKLKHVWEVIQELDAWMQHGVYLIGGVGPGVRAFECARDILAAAFPDARKRYLERAGVLGEEKR